MIQAPPNLSGYRGYIATIQLGRTGLFTDAAQSDIPTSSLIRANNVTYYNQVLQKDYGSRIWNSSPLPASVVRAQEMYPDAQAQNQRLYALCSNGQVYKFTNYFTQAQVTPASSTDPASLFTSGYNSLVVGGNEETNFPKKLFVLNGYNPVQVISGDATQRTTISLPAFDWTGTNQPFGGVIHRGSLFAWGNINNPHTVYKSNAANHEDFQTVSAAEFYTVYPGESDGVVAGCVFRGRLYIAKYPLGLYYLVDSDPDPGNWYFAKQQDDFGVSSPQGMTIGMNDLLIANNYGSITSLLAALIFGDTISSDIFQVQSNFRFAQNEVRADVPQVRSMVYYAKKKQLLCAFQSGTGNSADRIAIVDYKNPSSTPRVSWSTKDLPNCLFLVRDQFKVPKPFYGSTDGNLYEMDVSDHWVGSETDTTNQKPYLFDAQTPYMNFSQESMMMGGQVKTFDFLEIEYEPTGDFDCNVDIFLDQRQPSTYTFKLSGRSNLNEMPLNSSLIDGEGGFFVRFPIYGEARTISLRFYNNGLGQDVRLVRAYIYYRISGQQQES